MFVRFVPNPARTPADGTHATDAHAQFARRRPQRRPGGGELLVLVLVVLGQFRAAGSSASNRLRAAVAFNVVGALRRAAPRHRRDQWPQTR